MNVTTWIRPVWYSLFLPSCFFFPPSPPSGTETNPHCVCCFPGSAAENLPRMRYSFRRLRKHAALRLPSHFLTTFEYTLRSFCISAFSCIFLSSPPLLSISLSRRNFRRSHLALPCKNPLRCRSKFNPLGMQSTLKPAAQTWFRCIEKLKFHTDSIYMHTSFSAR